MIMIQKPKAKYPNRASCHPARARILLKQQKPKVIFIYPFTIKLTYQVENLVFIPTRATLDEGRTCGIGVVQENKTYSLALYRGPK